MQHDPNFPLANTAHIDDWFVFATSTNNKQWYVNTEIWPEWLDAEELAATGLCSAKEYILEVAFQFWNELNWKEVPAPK